MDPSSRLTETAARRFAAIALANVTREYPNRLDHDLRSDDDLQPPRVLHPAFFGSFDWHSCVENVWLLAFLLRHFPQLEPSEGIVARLDATLAPETIAGEVAYAADDAHRTFERPYGWAWLLLLAAELRGHPRVEAARWSVALDPLSALFADRFIDYLQKATYPIRTGTHGNSAFALTFAHAYASRCNNTAFRNLIEACASRWYGNDVNAQAWEPSGEDFLSPVLAEAVCMQRVLPGDGFHDWFTAFLPALAASQPATLFAPVTVSDRTDGRIAHLDGLNLSRAWCWRLLSRSVDDAALEATLLDAAQRHLDSSLPHVADHYVGAHWLAVDATLALTALD